MAGQSRWKRWWRPVRSRHARVLAAGAVVVLASLGGVATTAAQVPPEVSVVVELDPTWVPSDAVTAATATATVTAEGVSLPQQTVSFTTDGDVTFSPDSCQTDASGTCTTTITASETAGQETITATSSGPLGTNSGSATLSVVDPASRLTLFLRPSAIPADGSSTAVTTLIVRDSEGNGVANASPLFGTDGNATFGQVADHEDGAYTTTITASDIPGLETISVNAGGRTATAPLLVFGEGDSLALELEPESIPADGATPSTAAATVTDVDGRPVPNETINFTDPDGSVTFSDSSTCTTGSDGTCNVEVTGVTAGEVPITAATAANPNVVTDTRLLTLTPGPPAPGKFTLVLEPKSIAAGGTSAATVTVLDANDNGVPGRTTGFRADPPDGVTFEPGSCETDSAGTCSSVITATKAPEVVEITAEDAADPVLTATENLEVTVGPVVSVTLDLDPPSIRANESAMSTATATVTDAHGNGREGETVTFETDTTPEDGGVTFAQPTDNGDGTYAAKITASDTPGTQQITATVGQGADAVSDSAPLTLFGPTATIQLTLDPDRIPADGESASVATAVLADQGGRAVTDATVAFGTDANGDVTFEPGRCETDSAGTCSSVITASTTIGNERITAIGDGRSETATLAEFDPNTSITLVVEPASIPADGQSTATATATVTHVADGAVTDETVVFDTDGDVTFSPGSCQTDAGGTCTSTVTASPTPGTEAITATATNANVAAAASLEESPTAPPTLTGVSPLGGPEAGGTTVTLTGTDFVKGGTTVKFGATKVPATDVVVEPDGKRLEVKSPLGEPGEVEVTVTTPGGTATKLDAFTYLPKAQPTSLPAVFRGATATWFDQHNFITNGRITSFEYGTLGDVPLSCAWLGSGVDLPVVYRENQFLFRTARAGGPADLMVPFGKPGDIPVCGDWDGDGIDTIGVFSNGTWILRDENSESSETDREFTFGAAGDLPVVGDWDGGEDHHDGIGVQNGNAFDQRLTASGGKPERSFTFGRAGDQAVIGDWDANGTDTVGLKRSSTWFLTNDNAKPDVFSFFFGKSTDIPLSWR